MKKLTVQKRLPLPKRGQSREYNFHLQASAVVGLCSDNPKDKIFTDPKAFVDALIQNFANRMNTLVETGTPEAVFDTIQLVDTTKG